MIILMLYTEQELLGIKFSVLFWKQTESKELIHNSSEYYNETEEKKILIEVGFEHRTNNWLCTVRIKINRTTNKSWNIIRSFVFCSCIGSAILHFVSFMELANE